MSRATPPPPPSQRKRATPPPPPSQRTPTTPPPASARSSPKTRPHQPKLTLKRVLSQLDQQVPPVERGGGYKASVFFVASMLVMVPLFYILLILGLALLLILLTANFSSVASNPIAFALYGMLLLFGAVFVLFMLKPLFAPRGKGQTIYSLDPHREPALFAFVQRLADALNAPRPKRIDITMDVNAGAGFRRGMLSVFGSSDLVLTIGLPLAAGMSMRQFAGVLAHELGHFTQGSAMRLTFIVNRINTWIDRVANERDAFDLILYRWRRSDTGLRYVAYVIRVCVWLTHWNLRLLMIGAHMISCHLMRQMEFDADKYEVRVAGSQTFRVTSMNMYALNFAMQWAHSDLYDSWLEHRLSDDLPAMMMAKVRQMQKHPEDMEKIRRAVLEAKTHLFDTHPSTADRIRVAHLENVPGIMTVEAPAHVFFSDFTGLCKVATLAYYRDVLGPEVDARNLVPTQALVEEQEANIEALKTLNRYFQGNVIGAHEIFLGREAMQPPVDAQGALRQLRESRQKMLAGFDPTAAALQRFEKAVERVRDLAHAWVILDSGFQINPVEFGLSYGTPQAVTQARQAADHEMRMAEANLNEKTRDTQMRLVTGLQLLRVPKVAERIEDAAQRQQTATKLLDTLAHLQRMWPRMARIRELSLAMSLLMSGIEGNEQNPYFINKVLAISRQIGQTLTLMRSELMMAAYPFQHGQGQISIANYALKEVPPEQHLGEMFSAAGEIYEKLRTLYYRCMAQLAVIAEKVESVFGLEPLAEPPADLGDPWTD